jgi:hypothetical protein
VTRLRAQLDEHGFAHDALPLAEPSVVPAVLADAAKFDAAVADLAAQGHHRVPYALTAAIARMAHDPGIVAAAEDCLQTDRWVMWGANIRRDTPNAAHRWHLDLESFLWPTLTVGVGLQGCSAGSATWFIPGAHRIGRGPRESEADGGDAAVLAAARGEEPRCGEPLRVAGFGDASFYVFNARCWHRGDPAASAGRVMLFLHYQRADARRVPFMLDYRRSRWSREAAPYLVSPAARDVNTAVARPPIRHRVAVALRRFRGSRA